MSRSAMQRFRIPILAIGGVVVVAILLLLASTANFFIQQPQDKKEPLTYTPETIDTACRKQVANPLASKNLGEGITLSLSVDKTSYKVGENVGIKWTVTNNNPRNVTLGIPSWAEVTICDETGKAVWTSPGYVLLDYVYGPLWRNGGGPASAGPRLFSAKESVVKEVVWNMTKVEIQCLYGKQACVGRNSGRVDSGEYIVKLSGLEVTYGAGLSDADWWKKVAFHQLDYLSVKFKIGASAGETVTIRIPKGAYNIQSGVNFVPSDVKVPKGSMLTIVNEDETHKVLYLRRISPGVNATLIMESSLLPGETVRIRLEQEGEYILTTEPHPWLKARVTVP